MLSLFFFYGFRTLSCNFHPASSNFPPSIPLIFLNFPPNIKPLSHALKTELFFPPRVCSSATHLFVRFQKYLRTPKQYNSIQQRILAWTNSSRRARRHVWCWVEFHPHHCLRGDFADDTFKRIFANESVWILIEISLKFVPRYRIKPTKDILRLTIFHVSLVSILEKIAIIEWDQGRYSLSGKTSYRQIS